MRCFFLQAHVPEQAGQALKAHKEHVQVPNPLPDQDVQAVKGLSGLETPLVFSQLPAVVQDQGDLRANRSHRPLENVLGAEVGFLGLHVLAPLQEGQPETVQGMGELEVVGAEGHFVNLDRPPVVGLGPGEAALEVGKGAEGVQVVGHLGMDRTKGVLDHGQGPLGSQGGLGESACTEEAIHLLVKVVPRVGHLPSMARGAGRDSTVKDVEPGETGRFSKKTWLAVWEGGSRVDCEGRSYDLTQPGRNRWAKGVATGAEVYLGRNQQKAAASRAQGGA